MAFHDLLFAAQIPASFDTVNPGLYGQAGSREPVAHIDDGFSRLASRLVRLRARGRRLRRTWVRTLRIGY